MQNLHKEYDDHAKTVQYVNKEREWDETVYTVRHNQINRYNMM